jgi:hypothetical protein
LTKRDRTRALSWPCPVLGIKVIGTLILPWELLLLSGNCTMGSTMEVGRYAEHKNNNNNNTNDNSYLVP